MGKRDLLAELRSRPRLPYNRIAVRRQPLFFYFSFCLDAHAADHRQSPLSVCMRVCIALHSWSAQFFRLAVLAFNWLIGNL